MRPRALERREKEAIEVNEAGKVRPSGAVVGTCCLQWRTELLVCVCVRTCVRYSLEEVFIGDSDQFVVNIDTHYSPWAELLCYD